MNFTRLAQLWLIRLAQWHDSFLNRLDNIYITEKKELVKGHILLVISSVQYLIITKNTSTGLEIFSDLNFSGYKLFCYVILLKSSTYCRIECPKPPGRWLKLTNLWSLFQFKGGGGVVGGGSIFGNFKKRRGVVWYTILKVSEPR